MSTKPMKQLSFPWLVNEQPDPTGAEKETERSPKRPAASHKRLVVDERQATSKRARAISDACVTVKR